MSTTYTVEAKGQTFTGTATEIATALVGSDAHPALLADTVREVEYHGTPVPAEETPEYRVVKDSYDRPCHHLACAVAHKHLHNVRYDSPMLEWVEYPSGKMEQVWVKSGHEVTVAQWSIVGRDGYSVESFDTRREARAALARMTR